MKKILASIMTFVILFTTMNLMNIKASENSMEVTNELAIMMAENFVNGIGIEKNIVADNPIKFYDKTGKAEGYIVNYYKENVPYGYVIFDIQYSNIISEYSFGENVKNPYEVIVSSNEISMQSVEETILYKTDEFTYGIIDNSTNTVKDNYGNTDSLGILKNSRDKKPTEWESVFIPIQSVYEDYTKVNSNHLEEFFAFGENYIKEKTGRYACAVSALTACAAFYNVLDYSNIADDYNSLWDNTSTSQIGESIGNIIYGSTNIYNIGSGFVSFCAQKGRTISQRTIDNPSYSFFTNCIDGGNIGLIHCGIISASNGERSGHTMPVEGYATIKQVTSNQQLCTLMVADGWNESVRFLNYNFSDWSDMRGTVFNG